MGTTVRIAGVVRESIVDGPGIRFVVFTQGCPHHCEGCHNPQSHDFEGGYDCELSKITAELDKNPLLSGVTFSGGEPFCQPEALYELAQEVKKRGLNLMTYSGYTYEQLAAMALQRPAVAQLLNATDLLVDGRFVLAERDLTLTFRGSRNQRIIDVAKTQEAGQVVLAQL
ncbi:anaerobic ribonucleoside-triphosphate reductase activating protein [Hydrogenoanaerobacterium sp.]|uniref:anaerobic ribonucleoside-triphosphate reductase activating protein n=1 Tax=Hydrogenoanaerobacterium sp. TaxID=2953763 RepID=UPI00289657A4|nr:anaerobic ribonucleoside-triphosphate reductase activating protein [Hydrogenoanaerobacterium sp.]